MKKEISIKSSNNIVLDGLFECFESSSNKCVVLCHGLSVDKEEKGIYTKLALKLVNAGYHTFRFDFRGHGKSGGKDVDWTITGGLEDLKSVISYLKSTGYDSFILIAASFSGGAVSLYSASNSDELKGIILWSALIDYEEKINPSTDRNKSFWGKVALERIKENGFTEMNHGFKLGKKVMDEIYTLKPWQELMKCKKPILFIHGSEDSFVPYRYPKKYADLIENAELVTIEGAEHGFHGDEDSTNKAYEETIKFIRNIL